MFVNVTENNFAKVSGLPYGIDTAIKALRPNSEFEVICANGGFNFTKWKDKDDLKPPSSQQIWNEYNYQKECAEWLQYAYDRKKEYVSLLGSEEKQLNILWDLINRGANLKETEWFKTIQSVKERHPKPSWEFPTK